MTRFRPAERADEQLFYLWRLRDESGPWYEGAPTDIDTHHTWFLERLRVSTMLVWVDRGASVGCVRVDANGEVAFQTARPQETRLLRDLKAWAAEQDRKLKFTVDLDDPKTTSLWRAGLAESPVRFFTYQPVQDDVQARRRWHGVFPFGSSRKGNP